MAIQDQITQAANAVGVPAWLALNIAQRESDFDNNAVGSAGEIGIFQILPSTAAQLGIDPTAPTQNISGGIAYLSQLLNEFGGDTQKAAAAFNCGPTCVNNAIAAAAQTPGDSWAAHIPASTQAYVVGVVGSLPSATSAAPQYAASPVNASSPAILVPGSPAPGTTAFDWEPFAWAGGGLLALLVLRRAISG
jgi:soluble lytic murein transglycosylase-like protein